MRKITFLNTLFLLISLQCYSQRKADIILPFESSIQTILTNELNGNIIVKEADRISNYNPETNKIDWIITENDLISKSTVNTVLNTLNDLNNPDLLKVFSEEQETLTFIENSPFIQANINGKDVIINSFSGEIVYNSVGKKYKIALSQYLLESNQFLFLAIEGKNVVCILYDLKNANEKWVTSLATTESYFKSLKGLFTRNGMTREDQVEITNDAIYTTFNNKLYKLNLSDGNLLWSPEYELNRFYISQNEKNIIIIKNTGGLLSSKQALNILHAHNGEGVWKNDIKTKFISYLEDWGEKILVAHNSGFNFYDYESGNKLWKKEPKGSEIKRVIAIENDYLYVAENEMMLIDQNGEKKWKKVVEISDDKEDPVYFLDKIENNRVFYLTGTYANMVDYSDGKKIWKRNLKLDAKRPTLYAMDEKSKSFLVYNDEKLFKLDPNSSEKLDPLAKLKVKNDKTMSGIELFDWGVALTGENDVIGVNLDGTIKYHNIYKEPGEASRRLLKTGALIGSHFTGIKGGAQSSLANATVTMRYRDANGKEIAQTNQLFSEKDQASLHKKAALNSSISSSINQTVLVKVEKRHQAMQQNTDFAFLFARGEGKESNYLVKVRKIDGEELDKIEIDNNKPIYQVDDITGTIYYANGKELRIFSKQ